MVVSFAHGWLTAFVLTALVVSVTGCGQGSSVEKDPEGVVRAFYAAIMEGDGARVCSHLSSELRATAVPAGRGTCESAFSSFAGRLSAEKYEQIRRAIDNATMSTRIEGDTAVVSMSSITELQPQSGTMTLVHGDSGWYITDVASGG